ncbi:MAG: amidohydrolase family protein [Deltaproteobacteria bacterium]|nr:amidohydrolase family protein [Deltaproteobacteria bacterium]
MPFDIAIRGATIFDGSGMPGYIGDVAIQGERLIEVGGRVGPARREFHAEGLAMAPGFIDSHTHMDAQILWDPLVTSSSYHGVTTVVMGNCGLSLAPCKPEDRDTLLHTFARVEGMEMSLLRAAVDWGWIDAAGYLEALERIRPALNVGVLVGHCALRQYVMGEDSVERTATAGEVGAMQALLRDAMRAGVLGFSTNQNPRHIRDDGKPLPSRMADAAEIEALGQALSELNRGVIQMSSAPQGPARIARIADFSLQSGRPVVWNGILHSWSNPSQWRELLQATEQAFRRGARAWANTNARAFNNRFTLKDAQEFDEFPTWRSVMLSPLETRRELFLSPEVRAKLCGEAVEDPKPGTFHKRWDLVYIVKPALERNAYVRGWSVADLARSQGKEVLDAFLDLALEEDLETRFQTQTTNGDPEAVGQIVASPYTVLGQSDAGAHLAIDAGFGYCTGLLATYVRERKALPMEAAVRKLTWMQAQIFGIPDRGLLRPGMTADVVVFDPATVAPYEPELVHDLPGGAARLVQRAEGIRLVVVNGEVILESGKLTGARPGKVLRGSGPSAKPRARRPGARPRQN